MRHFLFSTILAQVRNTAIEAALPRLRDRGQSWLRIVCCSTALLVLSGATAYAQAGSNPYLLLPRYGDSGVADAFFFFDLGNGSGSIVDQLRRAPDSGRVARSKTNLFSEIGRSRDQSAPVGEIFLGPIRGSDGRARAALFVEASTGYTVYFDQLGKGGKLGRMTTMIKRGFESVAAADGNFALLMRRGSSGRTDGAYLYHGTTGKASYLGKLNDLEIDPPVTSVAKLPALAGQVSAAPIVSSEETIGYMVIDNADGTVHFFDLSESIGRMAVRTASFRLSTEMTAETLNPSSQRFVPVPLQDDEATTYAVLILDVSTGMMGLVDGLLSPRPKFSLLRRNVYSLIRGGLGSDTPRNFAAADANRSDGSTVGVWVLDSRSGDLVYVDSPGDRAKVQLRRMDLKR